MFASDLFRLIRTSLNSKQLSKCALTLKYTYNLLGNPFDVHLKSYPLFILIFVIFLLLYSPFSCGIIILLGN
jgi:hypothetical protein